MIAQFIRQSDKLNGGGFDLFRSLFLFVFLEVRFDYPHPLLRGFFSDHGGITCHQACQMYEGVLDCSNFQAFGGSLKLIKHVELFFAQGLIFDGVL